MFLTLRHFHDQNALKTYGHDGPLKPNQEWLLQSTSNQIIDVLNELDLKKVCLLYTEKTRRIKQTARLIADVLSSTWIEVRFQHDKRLEVMDQWDLILPENYKDWDRFTPLDEAWDAICHESYANKNILYRFWDGLNGKYPILDAAFSRVWESMGYSLINKYSLIYSFINNRIVAKDEQLLVVAQSDLPLIVMEMQALQSQQNITPENLPYKCWEIYKSGLQDKMYDTTVQEKWNFDTPMGYVGRFDLSDLRNNGFADILKNAEMFLLDKYNNEK